MTDRPTVSTDHDPSRRPIPQRSSGWAVRIANALKRAGVRPNHISVLSVLFAVLSCVLLVVSAHADHSARAALLVVAAVCIPLRLVCNMFDGMLAVEGGLRSPTGELFNEVPDRISDLLFFAGAGYAAIEVSGAVTLGWVAGALAVLTAYVRTLGVSSGTAQYFGGVLPKQARMWLLMAGILLTTLDPLFGLARGSILVVVLWFAVVGTTLTVVTRLRSVAAELTRNAVSATGSAAAPTSAVDDAAASRRAGEHL